MEDAPPDVFVLAVASASGRELELLDRARHGQDTEHVPVVSLLDRMHHHLVLDAFGRRADDVVSGQLHPSELIARLRTRIERPMRERKWKVTPRTGSVAVEAVGAGDPPAVAAAAAAAESTSAPPTLGKQAGRTAPSRHGSAPSSEDTATGAEIVHDTASSDMTAAGLVQADV